MYLVWSQEYKGWYAEPGRGITLYFEDAFRYTLEEAEKHIREIKIERSNERLNALPEALLKVCKDSK